MNRVRALLLALTATALLAGPALAIDPEEQLKDPRQEARARVIEHQLRCVVCQSETIADSSAPVAKALRTLVRDRIVAGDDDKAVMNAVTARYGDFVLLQPRFSPVNAVLWLGPFIVLLGGAVGAVLFMRRHARQAQAAPEPLSAQESAELSQVLADPADEEDRPA
jgi:cytochrome c-type biogenesis protein CcmH